MSIQALNWALYEELETKGAERLVLIVLADHCNDQWECWPSVTRIAQVAHLSEPKYVKELLGRLIDKGLIERTVNGAPDNRVVAHRRPNLYRLLPNQGVSDPPVTAAARGVTVPGLGGSPTPNEGGQRPPRTIIEPPTEPEPNPLAPVGAGGSLELELINPAPKQTDPLAAVADRLARAEWERLPTKPVAGFLALRARIKEALEAGYSEAEIARALPQIKAFSRNGFDLALRKTKPTPTRHNHPSLQAGRDLPSGEVHL